MTITFEFIKKCVTTGNAKPLVKALNDEPWQSQIDIEKCLFTDSGKTQIIKIVSKELSQQFIENEIQWANFLIKFFTPKAEDEKLNLTQQFLQKQQEAQIIAAIDIYQQILICFKDLTFKGSLQSFQQQISISLQSLLDQVDKLLKEYSQKTTKDSNITPESQQKIKQYAARVQKMKIEKIRHAPYIFFMTLPYLYGGNKKLKEQLKKLDTDTHENWPLRPRKTGSKELKSQSARLKK
jgi:hypothetical protein